jgi:hypothetical protein
VALAIRIPKGGSPDDAAHALINICDAGERLSAQCFEEKRVCVFTPD